MKTVRELRWDQLRPCETRWEFTCCQRWSWWRSAGIGRSPRCRESLGCCPLCIWREPERTWRSPAAQTLRWSLNPQCYDQNSYYCFDLIYFSFSFLHCKLLGIYRVHAGSTSLKVNPDYRTSKLNYFNMASDGDKNYCSNNVSELWFIMKHFGIHLLQ